MGRLRLLDLPTEIQLSIAEQLSRNDGQQWSTRVSYLLGRDEPGHTSLLHLAQTCSQLHHLVMCPENDLLWKHALFDYGIHPDLQLDDVLCAGTSHLEQRSWRKVCRLTVLWSKPFQKRAPGSLQTRLPRPSHPKPSKALTKLRPHKSTQSEKYTIDLACVGYGDIRGVVHAISEPRRSEEEGRLLLRIRRPYPFPGMASRLSTVILDAATPNSPIQAPGKGIQSVKVVSTYDAYPHQSAAGFFTELASGDWILSKTDLTSPQQKWFWNLGPNTPDRMASNGDILVAMTTPMAVEDQPTPQGQRPQQPTHLMCVRGSREKYGSGKTSSTVLWEYDITQKWAESKPYYAHPVLRIFHLTKNHLVALTTRHNASPLLKLTAIRFLIIDIKTGNTVRTLTFPKDDDPEFANTAQTAGFTTSFDHNFVLTDTHIVSGGLGGELFVWAYNDTRYTRPVYMLPSPFGAKKPPGAGAGSVSPDLESARFWSNIAVSVCGRWLGATTSDQLWVFDMLEKRVEGVWNNGRKITKNNAFARNPPDDFPGGVWVRRTEWVEKKDGEGWERGRVETAYLTGLDIGGGTAKVAGVVDWVKRVARSERRVAVGLASISLLGAVLAAIMKWSWSFQATVWGYVVFAAVGILLFYHSMKDGLLHR